MIRLWRARIRLVVPPPAASQWSVMSGTDRQPRLLPWRTSPDCRGV